MRTRGLIAAVMFVLVSFVGLTAIASAQCLTCDTNPGGHCVFVSSGFGSCTSAYYPDDFCKLACPNCPGGPCDPNGGGGGGGGDCSGNFSLTTLGNDQTVVTDGVLIRSNAIANGRLFRQDGMRVLSGAAAGGFEVDRVLAQLKQTVGWTYSPLTMAYAFQNVNAIARPVRFATASGDGFAIVAAGRGATTRLQLGARSANRFGSLARPTEAEIGPNDVLLMPLRIDGQSYILAVRSEAITRTSPDLTPHVSKLGQTFQMSIDRSRSMSPALVMKMPDC